MNSSPTLRIDEQVAEALEHAVAVVVGKRQLAGARHAHETRRAALERAVGPAFGVGGGDEEIDGGFDEGPVVGREGGAGEALQAIGDAAAVELVLQSAIAWMIEGAVGHRPPPRCALHSRHDTARSGHWRVSPHICQRERTARQQGASRRRRIRQKVAGRPLPLAHVRPSRLVNPDVVYQCVVPDGANPSVEQGRDRSGRYGRVNNEVVSSLGNQGVCTTGSGGCGRPHVAARARDRRPARAFRDEPRHGPGR